MANVVSWIRECDQAHFHRFFETRPGIELQNARIGEFEWKSMDGLLLTGGEDISKDFLRQQADSHFIEDPQPARDEWEFEILSAALQAGTPILAICRGHQVLNVALGGSLHLDIAGHRNPEMKMQNIQSLRYAASSRTRFEQVNSSHHQAVDRLGDGLEVEAWCAADGIIEQVRLSNYPFAVGVQYHPERDWLYESLFADFFDFVEKNDSRQFAI